MDRRIILLNDLFVSHRKLIDGYHNTPFNNSILLEFCELFVDFIHTLNPRNSIKRFDYVFTTSPNLVDKNVLNAHLFTAYEYAQSFIIRIRENSSLNLNNEVVGVAFDYPLILQAIEKVYGIPFGKFYGNRNMKIDSYTSYKVAAQFFWSPKQLQRSNTLNAYTIFALRQAIELAGKEILGLEAILNEDGSVFKYGTQLPWDFIITDKASLHFEFPFCPIEVHKIFKWSNYFIHTGQDAFCYTVALALTTVKKIYQKESILNIHGQQIFQGANKIRDYVGLKQEFEYYIRNKFSKSKTAKWAAAPLLSAVIT